MGNDERENFTAAVKDVIAGRAGYRCCFLSCGRVTIGPGACPTQIASIGVACHIYSASPNGPRGRGGLTADQLRDPENGFWACGDHAKLIDTNAGSRYPAGTLLSWRGLHEARVHREMGGVRLPVNWLESIEVLRSPIYRNCGKPDRPLFKAGERLTLSKVTLLIGSNASGKSALCDWIGGTAEEGSLGRWKGSGVGFSLRIHNPDAHSVVVESLADSFQFRLDGTRVPFNPLPVAVHVLRNPPPPRHGRTDLDWVAAWLGITPQVVRRLAARICEEGSAFVESFEVDDAGEIVAATRGMSAPMKLGYLGGGGTLLVALALAVVRASNTSLHSPTLLVLDGFEQFDSTNKSIVLNELVRQQRFQTVATLPSDDPRLSWAGWSLSRITKTPDGNLIGSE